MTNDADDEIALFNWGRVPFWADDPEDTYRPINARSETLVEKPMFREACKKRRCQVLSSGFYEWQEQQTGNKRPYRVCLEDDAPFAMAGTCRQYVSVVWMYLGVARTSRRPLDGV